MYKTGKKGCLREYGSLVFLDRTAGDTLIKLRGLRIELNESQGHLAHHTGRNAVRELPLPARSHESDKKGPRNVTEGELQRPRAPPKFEETDFSTVGGSSLLLFRLQNILKERMGVQMPLHELYQASRLGKTAAKTSKEK